MSIVMNEMPRPTRFSGADLLRLLLLIGLATLLLPGLGIGARTVVAQDRSVEWSNFDVTLDLEENASYHVTERQVVTFTGGAFRNGFRNIPLARTEGMSNVTVNVTVSEVIDGRDVPYTFVAPGAFAQEPETYTAEVRGSEIRIDWSFPPTTNASRTFLVGYDVFGALRVYDEADPPYQEISWIVVDSDLSRTAPVREASFTINLPVAVEPAETQVYPADDPAAHTEHGQTWTWSDSNLSGGETFEVGLRFPPIVPAVAPAWQAAADAQQARAEAAAERSAVVNFAALGIGLLLLVLGGMGIFGIWYTRGRDPHVGVVADFLAEPPDDLPPGVAGTLIDEVAGEHEFVATLIDLGKRRIIKINEVSSDGFLGLGIGATRDFELTLLQHDPATAKFETDLLRAIFGHDLKEGATVRLSDVKPRVDTARPAILNDLYSELVKRGYFLSSPEQTRNQWRATGWVVVGLAVLAGFALVSVGSFDAPLIWIPVIALVILGLVLVIFSGAFPKKTEAGADAAARWRAFRKYLASIERYEDLTEAKDIFDRYLPYAVAFRVDRSWVQKFAAVQAPVPQWFEGDGGGGMSLPGPYYGPAGRRMRRRGGSVVVIPGAGWPDSGRTFGGGSRDFDGDGGGFGLPDLQDTSDTAGRSLQSASGGLFDLLNSAGKAFGGMSSGGGSGRSSWGGGGGFSGGGGGGGRGGGGGGGGFS